MLTRLRNTVGSMIGCGKKERKRRLSVRDSVAVLRLRFLILILIYAEKLYLLFNLHIIEFLPFILF